MASSEWVLGVQIKHFKNLYNVETKSGLYCCCDNADVPCSENITHEDGKCCDSDPTHFCEPYFLIHVANCPHSQACSVPKTNQFQVADSSALDQLILYIPLMEMELSNEVRIKLLRNVLLSSHMLIREI